MFRGRAPFAIGFAICAASMAVALFYFQHHLGLEPCPLCIFQRIAAIITGLIFLIGLIHGPRGLARRVYGGLLTLASLAGIGIAGRHVWLQYFADPDSLGCGPGLQFMLQNNPLSKVIADVLKGTGDCGEIVWTLFGISIPGWTLLLFLVLLGVSLGILLAREERPAV